MVKMIHYLDVVLTKHQVSPDVRMEVNDIPTLLQLVGSGRWATVLMGSSVFNNRELKVIKITGEGMTRFGSVTRPNGAYRKKAASILCDFLVKHAKNHHVDNLY